MQIFHYISVAVPLLISFGLPYSLRKMKAANLRKNRIVLYVGCMLFFISWYLPSPLIDGHDTSFVTHFVGGGLFCALLGWYIKRSFSLRISWLGEMVMLFALVSSLGVVNELFEFALVKLDIASINLFDTSWDIVANTLGALTGYVIIKGVEYGAPKIRRSL